MSGLDTLQQWADRLRGMGGVVTAGGPEVIVSVMQSEMSAAVSESRAVDGYKWAPRKKDGAAAFSNGMKYVTTRIMGAVVLITLKGPMAFAQFGTGKMKSRPLLPMGGLPSKLGAAIAKGIAEMSGDWMVRGGRHDKKTGRMWR